jgi:uncharacterized protein YyaL (SSP411 family)
VLWLPWHPDAFARAAREQKPILLSISAAWCRACHAMDQSTYTDRAVQAMAAERFIAIRVDADERPDIDKRYNLGGWPTTAFLTPTGDVIGGGTYLDANRMASVLRQVADAYPSLRDRAWTGAMDDSSDAASASPPDAAQIFASFDEEFGGFGIEPKFPHTSPLLLAIALYRDTADAHHRRIVERTLDAIANGGLHDRASGGYYRYATTRDWQLPHQEKLLETNARLLAAFVESASTFGRAIDREHAEGLGSFIRSLASADGGYAGSDGDTRVFGSSTAEAVAALLAAAELMDDLELVQAALRQFEGFLLKAYRPAHGIAHFAEGDTRVGGLLADQISTGLALLSAFALTGDEPYRMMAAEIGHYVLRWFAAPGGGFVDRIAESSDVGLLRQARVPFAANCDAAVFFARLTRASREPAFDGVAETALDRAAPLAVAHGPEAARWRLAEKEVR